MKQKYIVLQNKAYALIEMDSNGKVTTLDSSDDYQALVKRLSTCDVTEAFKKIQRVIDELQLDFDNRTDDCGDDNYLSDGEWLDAYIDTVKFIRRELADVINK